MTEQQSNLSSSIPEPTHWILRAADGKHFWSSSKDKIWGINSKHNTQRFMKDVKPGDILWFLTNKKAGGKFVAFATYERQNERILGPLLQLTKSNEELGWTKQEGDWDIEIHYKDLYDVSELDLCPDVKAPQVVRPYNEKCQVNLPLEYQLILYYSRVKAL